MITFYNIPGVLKKIERDLESWIVKVIDCYAFKAGDVSFTFVSVQDIVDINRKYLNHDYPTDIITFDYSKNRTIHGDIYISAEVVKENAYRFEEDYQRELKRVVVHGILHLLGFNDGTDEEKSEMRREEDYCLDLQV